MVRCSGLAVLRWWPAPENLLVIMRRAGPPKGVLGSSPRESPDGLQEERPAGVRRCRGGGTNGAGRRIPPGRTGTTPRGRRPRSEAYQRIPTHHRPCRSRRWPITRPRPSCRPAAGPPRRCPPGWCCPGPRRRASPAPGPAPAPGRRSRRVHPPQLATSRYSPSSGRSAAKPMNRPYRRIRNWAPWTGSVRDRRGRVRSRSTTSTRQPPGALKTAMADGLPAPPPQVGHHPRERARARPRAISAGVQVGRADRGSLRG